MSQFLLALAAGCGLDEPKGQGIAIGNPPGTVQVRVTVADGNDVAMESLVLPVSGVYVETCAGRGAVVDARRGTVLGLDEGFIEIDAGTYCVLGILPTDEPVQLNGTAGLGSFVFTAALGRILVYGEVSLEAGGEAVLELAEPDWLTAADFGLGAGEVRRLQDPCLDDPLCARIRGGLMDQSALYDDADGDGRVGADERDAGAEASGPDRRDARD